MFSSLQEFESEYQELWDWLMDMDAMVTDSHQLMMSEEQRHHLFKVRQDYSDRTEHLWASGVSDAAKILQLHGFSCYVFIYSLDHIYRLVVFSVRSNLQSCVDFDATCFGSWPVFDPHKALLKLSTFGPSFIMNT